MPELELDVTKLEQRIYWANDRADRAYNRWVASNNQQDRENMAWWSGALDMIESVYIEIGGDLDSLYKKRM